MPWAFRRSRLYLLGAPLLQSQPLVPLLGNLSSGIALMSTQDTLSCGFTADWDTVPDLHALVLAIEHSCGRLAEAVGVTS